MNGPFDLWVLQGINHWVASSDFLSSQAVFFNNSELPNAIIAVSIVAIWFSENLEYSQCFKRRCRVLTLLLSMFPTYFIARVLQGILHRPRPIVQDVSLEVIGDPEILKLMKTGFSSWGSFPSDHAALLFIFATVIFTLNKKLGVLSFVLSSYYCLLRVAIGYHWPSDILGGALLGMVVTWALLQAEPKLAFLFEKIILWTKSHTKAAYACGFLFLADFANGFDSMQGIAHAVFHTRLFH